MKLSELPTAELRRACKATIKVSGQNSPESSVLRRELRRRDMTRDEIIEFAREASGNEDGMVWEDLLQIAELSTSDESDDE